VLVLPADERQHIQPISAVRQADPQHPTGMVMLGIFTPKVGLGSIVKNLTSSRTRAIIKTRR
jgi:hypothetical protein